LTFAEAESHHVSRDTRNPLIHLVAEMSYDGVAVTVRLSPPWNDFAMHLPEMHELCTRRERCTKHKEGAFRLPRNLGIYKVEAKNQIEDLDIGECNDDISESVLELGTGPGSEGIKGVCGCAPVPASTTSLLIWSNVNERPSSFLANAYHILEADDNARCADNVFQQPGTITPAIFSPTNNLRNKTQL
jgi:hypothetical protein